MPFHIEWYQQNRVIFEKFFGNVTLDDVRGLNAQSSKMFIAGTPLIHVIVDLSEVESFPRSMAAIKEAIKSRTTPDRLGWVLIFGTKNPILKFFVSVIAQVAGDRVRFRLMDTFEQAENFLLEQDQTIIQPENTQDKADDNLLPLNH